MAATCLVVDGCRTTVPVRLALRWHQRALGLLATSADEQPAGLWIAPCSSVHMLGMRYAIDLVFLDQQGRVLRAVERLRPWRARTCWGAHIALELRTGLIAKLGLRPGQTLSVCTV